jgi:hypothetical protein
LTATGSDSPDIEDGLNVSFGNEPGIGQRPFVMNPVFRQGNADIRNMTYVRVEICRRSFFFKVILM